MSTRLPGRLARLLSGLVLFGVSVALGRLSTNTGELVPDPGRDAAASVMLDELARLTAALAPLRVTA
ncbi:hypothetical protein [Micromonospora sp. WMMD737]|uniref:hypothetical protein n=1 Tax=Micromonospora sp. WMMD737 TaxID=3404113 RepID=UPI003B925C47